MPVKKMPPRRASPLAEDLRRKLVEEWTSPKEKGEPLILQDSSGPPSSRSTRIYVVWTEWGDLSLQERSEIIMDAYEQTHSTDETLSVTVALGLTPPEADRMRIPYD